MKYLLLLLLLTSPPAYADHPTNPKVVFLLSCERTSLRIIVQYFDPTDLAVAAAGLIDTCARNSSIDFKKYPAGQGCLLAISMVREMFPKLPSHKDMFASLCQSISE